MKRFSVSSLALACTVLAGGTAALQAQSGQTYYQPWVRANFQLVLALSGPGKGSDSNYQFTTTSARLDNKGLLSLVTNATGSALPKGAFIARHGRGFYVVDKTGTNAIADLAESGILSSSDDDGAPTLLQGKGKVQRDTTFDTYRVTFLSGQKISCETFALSWTEQGSLGLSLMTTSSVSTLATAKNGLRRTQISSVSKVQGGGFLDDEESSSGIVTGTISCTGTGWTGYESISSPSGGGNDGGGDGTLGGVVTTMPLPGTGPSPVVAPTQAH